MRRSRSSCTSISTAGKPRCCCTRFSRHARPSHYQRSVYGRQMYRGLATKREGADISRCRSKLYPRRSRTSTNLVRTLRAYSAMSRELLGEVSTLADCMSGPGGGISVCSDEIRRQLRRRRQARTGLLVHLRDADEQLAEEGRVALEGQRHRTSPALLRSGQPSRNPASPALLRFVQPSSDLLLLFS